jgi:hypothetical protein
MNEIEEGFLDMWLEHTLAEMEERKIEIEEEAYLFAKVVGTENIKKLRRVS